MGSTWGALLIDAGAITERVIALQIGQRLDALVSDSEPAVEQVQHVLTETLDNEYEIMGQVLSWFRQRGAFPQWKGGGSLHIDTHIRRMLGTEGELGQAGLGLSPTFAVDVIRAVGNYGEIYDRYIGPQAQGDAFPLPRAFNRLWTDGGLIFAPPLR